MTRQVAERLAAFDCWAVIGGILADSALVVSVAAGCGFLLLLKLSEEL